MTQETYSDAALLRVPSYPNKQRVMGSQFDEEV